MLLRLLLMLHSNDNNVGAFYSHVATANVADTVGALSTISTDAATPAFVTY